MDTKKKEEALLMLIQVLKKACDDMDYIAKGLDSDNKDLLNAVNNTVLDASNVVNGVLIQDKKNDLLVDKLQKDFVQVIDFLSEYELMPKFIEYKSKNDE